MSDFIDRDPEEMLLYAKDVDRYVSQTVSLLQKVNSLMDSYGLLLDYNCQNCVKKVKDTSDKFIAQTENYKELAKTMRVRADKLKTAQEKGGRLFR